MQHYREKKTSLVHPLIDYKTVVIVTDTFPPATGGMAYTAYRISNHLDYHGVPTTVVVFNEDKVRCICGKKEWSLNTNSIMSSFDRHANMDESCIQVVDPEMSPYCVISLYMGRNAYFGYLLSRKLKLHHYIVCVGSDIHQHFETYYHKWRYEKLVKKARKIGILSDDMYEKVSSIPNSNGKIMLLNPGFNHELFRPMQRLLKYDFLYVGYARPVKGLDYFLKILPSIDRKCRVCLVAPHRLADLNYYNECINAAKNLSLQHEIHWYGQTPPEELVELYNSSRFVIVPSKSEGAPHVVLEAMGCNRPIIATDVGRISEFLGSKDTLFNSDAEFIKLLELALDGSLLEFPNARERAIKLAGSEIERISYRRFIDFEQ